VGLHAIVVVGVEPGAGEREQQDQAVRHQQLATAPAAVDAVYERARRDEMDPVTDRANPAAEEMLALVKPAEREVTVPRALDHPVVAALERRPVIDQHIAGVAIHHGEPGEPRELRELAVAERLHVEGRLGVRRRAISATRRATARRQSAERPAANAMPAAAVIVSATPAAQANQVAGAMRSAYRRARENRTALTSSARTRPGATTAPRSPTDWRARIG